MKRRIRAFFMAMLMVSMTILGCLTDMTTARADELILKLHYHREDGDYAPWDVWMWEAGKDGAGYAFAEEDGEMVATMTVTPGTMSVGFIVRTQDWEKDINADQFIDISEMATGTVHAYVESGIEGYTKEYGADAVIGTKLKKAVYNDDSTITVTMTGNIEGDFQDVFAVAGKTAGDVAVVSVDNEEDAVYKVTLEKELDVFRSYTISYDQVDYKIVMPNKYSTEEFEAAYTYTGNDLGATWSKESTLFRVWAPTADEVAVNLYESGVDIKNDLIETIPMTKDANGTWVAEKKGNLNGVYYTYTAVLDGSRNEVCDPYARTTGVNGKRAMILDLASTNPAGWDDDANPHAGETINDAVIYELQIRDLGADESSGITNAGKYLSLTETGTKTANGTPTGLDHIKELGITHLHILPFYDFGSVDETHQFVTQYNWGYDPVNYNVPEGSYSTDPYDGQVRVAETKQMVKSLHDNNISVVMDVVYNHVYSADNFCVNRLVPGYFSRIKEDGTYSSGSGCGNDTATERSMVKKYIVDSVNYWADEYHIDGFRFDLVGLMDTELMNEIIDTVHEKHPDVIFYGEGWSMDTAVTKEGYYLATQMSSARTPELAFFNDTIRDGLKGNVFNAGETGYVSGALNLEDTIERCFMAQNVWSKNPCQTVNYAACHDNNTLYDRLQISRAEAGEENWIKMNNLAAAVYLLAEGVPFIMSGEELLRSKVNEDGSFNDNSYASSDEVNSIKWDTLDDPKVMEVNNYYKGLIAFRKEHKALRLTTPEEVKAAVKPVEGLDENVVAFDIDGTQVEGESAKEIFIIYNPNQESTKVLLPGGNWTVYVEGNQAGTEALHKQAGYMEVAPISTMVLARTSTEATAGLPVTVGAIVVVLIAIGVAVVVHFRKKKLATGGRHEKGIDI